MKIKVGWDNPAKTAVYIQFRRGWSWPDVQQAVQAADDLITSVPHTVSLIVDISEAGGLPRDFMTAAGDLFAQGDARPNEGKKIIVGAGALIRAAYNGFLAVYGRQMQNRPFIFARSLDEARNMVMSRA